MKSDPMNRRRFIKLGAASTGLAVVGVPAAGEDSQTTTEMKYRPLGKTGLKVSEISFGTYGFDNPELLSAAIDAGINLVCTSAAYQNGGAEEAIGRAIQKIGSRRNDLILYTGTTIRQGTSKEDILRALDESLRRLQTDRVEIFRTYDIDDPTRLQLDVLFEAFEEARTAGKALHLGLSGHGRNLLQCLNAAVDDGRFGAILCRYDFVSYRELDQVFSRAAQKGVGTVVFKIKAGERQNEIRDLEAGGLSFTQASVKWALSNSNVTSVCAGITNFDQIKEYCDAIGKRLTEPEIRMLERYAEIMYDQYCRNCGECESSCPKQVAVADIMRYAMYFKYYGREKDSMKLYASLAPESTAADCFSCDEACHGACPYGRRIRDGLLEAHEMLT